MANFFTTRLLISSDSTSKPSSKQGFLVLCFCMLVLIVPNLAESAPLLKRGEDGFSPVSSSKKGAASKETSLQEEVNQLRYELFKQNEEMQVKLQAVQGLLEQQDYQFEQFKKAERNRYADLDRRIAGIESKPTDEASVLNTGGGLAGTLDDEDEKTYLGAIKKVENKEYNAAIAELSLYLEFFPEGKYVAQANYWLGELYLALEIPEYANAKKHFNVVINDFSKHAKAPDSLYKLGMTELSLQNSNTAKVHFKKLIGQFPKSASAALAETQLSQLN